MSQLKPALSRRDHLRNRIAAVCGLVLTWNLLWGEFTWANLITGVLVAFAILIFFPLPPVTFAGRVRPLRLAWFLLRFFTDLLVASIQVAWLAFQFGKRPNSAIAAVQLRVRSDLNLTLVAEAVSLVPGSLITDADRENGILYIHMLGVKDLEHLERFKAGVLRLEARLVKAIGSDAELRMIQQPAPSDRQERPQ